MELNSCIPSLVVKDARAALKLYETAFGAQIGHVMEGSGGKVMHAAFKIGNTTLFINDDMEMMPRHPSPGTQSTGFYVYVPSCDEAYKRALDTGMTSVFEPKDMFWGDRTSAVQDEFGYIWSLCEHVRSVNVEEMEKARKEAGW
ncbi:VOC family protein [Parvularcula sp. LCG005]|uniref:VOC family protein n=1 Tax=Parvularcula sp. LCG005 TaxID=3078805 RepID=UPI002943CB36|nr:VOC family protein [Parvularcula sp. LCG005]WOI52739.1 VOC family protein [Parvularcula sp. LCG005]